MFWCHARLDPIADTRLSHKTPAMGPSSHRGDRARQQPAKIVPAGQPLGAFLRWILLFTVPVASDVPINRRSPIYDNGHDIKFKTARTRPQKRQGQKAEIQFGEPLDRSRRVAVRSPGGDRKYDNLLTISYRACQRQVNTSKRSDAGASARPLSAERVILPRMSSLQEAAFGDGRCVISGPGFRRSGEQGSGNSDLPGPFSPE